MLSKMYKHLAAFQRDKIASNDALARVSKMHWRRARSLETCLPWVSEGHIVQRQEITFELSEIYMELLEYKHKKFERTAGNLEPLLLQKMAYYCFTGIKHCESFLSTVLDESKNSSFTEEMIRPGVLVMFRKAKFYNKIFTPIGTDQVKFTELAIDSYQKIAEYCESHPHHRKHVQQEYSDSVSTSDMLTRQLKMHAKATQDI